jgi:hypothetical protein
MDEEFRSLKSRKDFAEPEASNMHHLQNLVLEDPDEVWLEQKESSERHFTFISHFEEGDQKFSYVVVCLTIEGVPSFVFLSFPTKDQELVEHYRKGRDLKVDFEQIAAEAAVSQQLDASGGVTEADFTGGGSLMEFLGKQGLKGGAVGTGASDENLKEKLERFCLENRNTNDIPVAAFSEFEHFSEQTLDDPDEIWTLVDNEQNTWYTFISRFSQAETGGSMTSAPVDTLKTDDDSQETSVEANEQTEETSEIPEAPVHEHFWTIVVCKKSLADSGGHGGLSVAFIFPTIDSAFVQKFRKGINSLNKSLGVGGASRAAA